MRKNTKTKKLTGKERLALAKEKAKEVIGNGITLDEETVKVQQMILEYETALGIYKCQPAFRFLTLGKQLLKKGTANYNNWHRAVMIAEELSMPYDLYIKAQFFYIHKWFKRAVKAIEISSYKSKISAVERAIMYLSEVEAPKGNIVGPTRPSPEVPQSLRWHNSEVELKRMCNNWNKTEQEIFQALAQGKAAFLFFDKEWLLQNKTYLSLKEAGEVH